jgi:hypothetical protein
MYQVFEADSIAEKEMMNTVKTNNSAAPRDVVMRFPLKVE